MKQIVFILALASVILLTNCGLSEDNFPSELPPVTITGENTFGALMNDEVYVPDGNWTTLAIDFDFPEPSNNYQFLVKTLRSSSESTLKDAELKIWQIEVRDIGLYDLFEATAKYKGIRYQNSEEYDTLSNRECGDLIGNIEVIHLDTINKIISGTFDMKLVKSDQPYESCLEITDGRFDLRIK